jgi:predicted nucleic acid-binding protein
MPQSILVDTGPLVALLNRRERQHVWTRERLAELPGPLLTCEAVLAEAAFLLQRVEPGNRALMTLLERQAVRVAFHLDEHVASVTRLMAKYANVPMSLADACLVRMTEIFERSLVLTLDRDFRIYRRHGRQAIPVIMPGPKV